ncbi:MAG: hypothetical protein R3B91_09530 [Planctomycetaceae bacterium]
MSGTVLGITDKSFRFEYKDQERTISMDRIMGIVMRKVDRPDADMQLVAHRLVLLNELTLPGQLSDISDEKVTFRLPWGKRLRQFEKMFAKSSLRRGGFSRFLRSSHWRSRKRPFSIG